MTHCRRCGFMLTMFYLSPVIDPALLRQNFRRHNESMEEAAYSLDSLCSRLKIALSATVFRHPYLVDLQKREIHLRDAMARSFGTPRPSSPASRTGSRSS